MCGHVAWWLIISESFLKLNKGHQEVKKAKTIVYEPHTAPVGTKPIQDVALTLPED